MNSKESQARMILRTAQVVGISVPAAIWHMRQMGGIIPVISRTEAQAISINFGFSAPQIQKWFSSQATYKEPTQ